MHRRARPAAKLVDLVIQAERRWQRPHGGMRRIFDPKRYLLMPWMTVEVRADHRAVIGPLIKGVGGAMDADEALARPDEVEQCLLLLVVHRQLAGGEEDHGVVMRQGVAREDRAVFRGGYVEGAGLAADG